MPNPNSTSAPVDGVVVLAPRTPVDGLDALLDALDAVEVEVDGSGTLVLDELDTTDEVDVEGSVTTVVSAVDDWRLVDWDDVVSLDVVVGSLLVDVVLAMLVDEDEVVLFDDDVVCAVDEAVEDVVLCVLLLVLCEVDVVELVVVEAQVTQKVLCLSGFCEYCSLKWYPCAPGVSPLAIALPIITSASMTAIT